ncbi:hypothetical protein OAG48_00400 [bacterium]|nr:hypothetical protein [bacterium]
MSIERRRIVFGNGESDHLDPFVVDCFGRVYNSRSKPGKAKKNFDRRELAKRWQQALNWGTGKNPAPPSLRLAGDENMVRVEETKIELILAAKHESTSALDYEQWNAVFDECAVWKFLDQRPRRLKDSEIEQIWRRTITLSIREQVKMTSGSARSVPPNWLPMSGDIDSGWVVLKIEKQFLTLFHGPSMAANVFD